jgi:hypothetical protein
MHLQGITARVAAGISSLDKAGRLAGSAWVITADSTIVVLFTVLTPSNNAEPLVEELSNSVRAVQAAGSDDRRTHNRASKSAALSSCFVGQITVPRYGTRTRAPKDTRTP